LQSLLSARPLHRPPPALVLECYVGRGVEIPRACADEEEEDIRGGSS
jgi:hypothetical protein